MLIAAISFTKSLIEAMKWRSIGIIAPGLNRTAIGPLFCSIHGFMDPCFASSYTAKLIFFIRKISCVGPP